MFPPLTELSFYQYLKCPHWVFFDAHGEGKKPHHPLLLKLLSSGLVPEEQRRLMAGKEDIAEVTAEDQEEAFLQTLGFMRAGRQTIYRGVLMDRHWIGHPDILEKVEGKSRFGDYYYVAADLKNSHHLHDDHKFQGCFYAELLERLQGTKPVQGYVMTPDGQTLAYLIEEFEAEYKLNLHEIEKIIAGQEPVHFVTSGCKQSPWFTECHGAAQSCQDLSLLNRIWREEIALLKSVGITTVPALAALSYAEVEKKLPKANHERLLWIHQQAQALVKGEHLIKGLLHFPEAATELYFDVEGDPLRDFEYLLGVLRVSQDGTEQYHLFAADAKEQSEKMWKEFVALIEANPAAPIYHYGTYERDVVRRFSQRYGISEIASQALASNMVDILTLARQSVIFPLPFYSLKDIGAYIGYEWQADDASGANSVLWFEEWIKRKDPKILQKIVRYNEDDVRATWKLKQWLADHCV